MVVSFKTNSDITLENHDFSKRQWRKICKALGAQDDDNVLWIEIPANTVELVCKPARQLFPLPTETNMVDAQIMVQNALTAVVSFGYMR